MTFSVQRAFADAMRILGRRIGPMLAITALYYVVQFALFASFGTSMAARMSAGMGPGMGGAAAIGRAGSGLFLLYLVIYALVFLQQAALCRLCDEGRDTTVGEALGAGLRSVPTMLGAALLLLVAMVVGVSVFSVVIGLVATGTSSTALVVVLSLAGVAGALLVGTRLSMILPVIAIEDVRNPATAIARAWRLTGGNTLRLAALFLLVLLAIAAAVVVLLLLTVGSLTTLTQIGQIGPGPMIGLVAGMVVFGLTIGLYLIALVAAVHAQLAGPAVAIGDTFA